MTTTRLPWRALWLALRAIFWAVVAPGLVAFYIPWRFFGVSQVVLDLRRPAHVLGMLLVMLGTTLLTACIVEFARSGRGTLSPVDPPRRLVVKGLYRFVRNPMYLSVTLILLGEIMLTLSLALLIYWGAWFLLVNLFVMLYEEPTLRRQFGRDYEEYARSVHRWIPRFRAPDGHEL